jgi:SAM-dependent methyltransferase
MENKQIDAHKVHWDSIYYNDPDIKNDKWIIDYLKPLENERSFAIDIGCGNGANVPVLLGYGYNVCVCDYSKNAIDAIKKNFSVDAMIVDIRKGLPYVENQFDLGIADLSLHYFGERDTIFIINEIKRVVKRTGLILIRVNSVNDIEFGFGRGHEIERNFFVDNGKNKRFFDHQDIDFYFGKQFQIEKAIELETTRYGKVKKVWEVVCENQKKPAA